VSSDEYTGGEMSTRPPWPNVCDRLAGEGLVRDASLLIGLVGGGKALELIGAAHRAVDLEMTAHWRQAFVTIIVDGMPPDAAKTLSSSDVNKR
jgi:hypothetical protein